MFNPTGKPATSGKSFRPVAALDIRPEEIRVRPALEFACCEDDDWGPGLDTWLRDENGNVYALCYWEDMKGIEIVIESDLPRVREKVASLVEWLGLPRQCDARWYGG
jgi:hypothetical protein